MSVPTDLAALWVEALAWRRDARQCDLPTAVVIARTVGLAGQIAEAAPTSAPGVHRGLARLGELAASGPPERELVAVARAVLTGAITHLPVDVATGRGAVVRGDRFVDVIADDGTIEGAVITRPEDPPASA